MAKIICVANPANNMGRTLSAVNLAASLAVLEKKVLIVDCDTAKKTSEYLGFTFDNYEYGLDDVLTGFVGGKGVVSDTALKFLKAIPAGHGLDEIEDNLFYNPDKEKILEIVIKKFREDYEYIIFDTPGNSGLLTQSALIASDEVFVPLRLGPGADDGLSALVSMLDDIREKFSVSPVICGILFTASGVCEEPGIYLSEDNTNRFHDRFFNSTIPLDDGQDDPATALACLTDIKSRLAVSFLDTAYEFLHRGNEVRGENN